MNNEYGLDRVSVFCIGFLSGVISGFVALLLLGVI